MSATIRLDDRVVVVTGAGGGLGRAHALALAKGGARVVVNDLPAAAGASSADQVVAEITNAGGLAVACNVSIAAPGAGEAVIDAARAAYGRIDALVANAGINHFNAFESTVPDDIASIMAVSFGGAYGVARAAWPLMKEQRYGRLVFTTSSTALYGRVEMAPYAAAKGAVLALSRTLALEGGPYNILSNAIAPYAATGMSRTMVPPSMVDALDPAKVSPLVVYLASEACTETNQLFAAGGGGFARLANAAVRVWRSPEGIADPADVRNNLDGATEEVKVLRTMAEESALLYSMVPSGGRR